MPKLKIWKTGDRSKAICPTCQAWRETVFEYRTVHLEQTGVDVNDVLVGVCTVCDTIASVPHQSAPKLREARRRASRRVDARVPKELKDVLGLLAAEFGGVPEPFGGGLIRYYLHEIAASPALARRVVRLSRSPEAEGTSGGRLAFHAESDVLECAWAVARRAAEARDQSELVRGIIVAAKQDAYDRRDPTRRAVLRAIAQAATV